MPTDDSYRRTEPDCLARGPSSPEKNEKDFRDVCPRIGTVIGLRYLSRWNPVRMDTFGQSIIAVPQQPTVGNSTVLNGSF